MILNKDRDMTGKNQVIIHKHDLRDSCLLMHSKFALNLLNYSQNTFDKTDSYVSTSRERLLLCGSFTPTIDSTIAIVWTIV